ncbi:MAG: ElyC/SanA/YdcF family protein [Propionicimonas sp.]|uniref:SanA/YdcF family protein n=1 Tax=Propionicimonas sp. TaxID=1955623 RepID=UPI002B2197BF|nr:ElyC/SanA/YdcF family protein [Propionicimonas sp.]MEA4945313.1 ElyC/SanA/YdcF family protein [Propionicimonas sp.]
MRRRGTIWGGLLAGLALAPGVLAGVIHLASRHRIVAVEQLPTVPVGLVLGAEVHPGGRPSGFLRARLDMAVELYRRGRVEQLLVSGDGRSRFQDEPAAMRAYLVAHGVPEAAIGVDAEGLDTYASCARARDVFGLRRLVVVSQRYHLPRALAICRLLGIEAWGVGDTSVRLSRRAWSHGLRREVAANLKLVWDVVTRKPWAHR